jgi:hypothetical protein
MARQPASKAETVSPKRNASGGKKTQARKRTPPALGCCTINVDGKDQAFEGLKRADCKKKAGANPWHWKAGKCFAK